MRNAQKRPDLELADILQKYGEQYYAAGKIPAHHLRTLDAIKRCRTAELGGHVTVCTDCGGAKISYNSCRNRHCPKCGGLARELWIQDRKSELLPIRYQHIVFTLPHEFNDFCRYNPNFCYSLLFRASWETLQTFANDKKWLGARAGATAVLHTWGQNLTLHPHVHCIVPTGGLGPDGRWVHPRKGGRSGFLFPVGGLKKVFRAIFLRQFMAAWEGGQLAVPPSAPTRQQEIVKWRHARYRQEWVVYAKAPFCGPEAVVEYLGRYTHKTAISNHRLQNIDDGTVTFRYKDYRHGGAKKSMMLSAFEFLRRFRLHILPSGFRRMRHYGILSNYHKSSALAAARLSLGAPTAPAGPKKSRAERVRQLLEDHLGHALDDCPDCGARDSLVRILLPPNCRAPPAPAGVK